MVKRKKKKESLLNAIDILSVLDLEHRMTDIMSSGCVNVDQVTVDSLVEICNEILLNAASDSEMFSLLNTGKMVLKRWKNLASIKTVLLNVKSILKLEI